MAKQKEKDQALNLRQQGTSISDIAIKLKVSKSTVSTWCKDITLTPEAIATIVKTSASKSTAALLFYTESLRAIRQNNILSSKEVGSGKWEVGSGKWEDWKVIQTGYLLYWIGFILGGRI